MSKNFVKRLSKVTALSLLMTPLAKAHLPFTAFKNVTNNFKEGMQHYSPTYGEVFYKEYLYNTINYNTFTSYFNNEGVHEYARDRNGDEVWQLAKYFFPSVSGEINISSQAHTNFARYVNDPKSIACLLNHAFAVKKIYKDHLIEIQTIKNLSIQPVLQNQQISKLNKTFTNAMNKLNKSCIDDVKKTLTYDSKTEEEKYTSEICKKIVTQISKTIQKEIELGYPEHTTLHIVNAFFTDKFDQPEHINTLLENLKDDIIDKTKLAQHNNHNLIPDDLELIQNKMKTHPEQVTLDDVYALKNAKRFVQVTPYAEDQPPVSNGDARIYKNITLYDQSQSIADIYKQENKAATFSDCVEVTIRHLFNLALYDNNNNTFVLDGLKQINTPYAQRLVELYNNHISHAQANSNDVMLRSFISMIVGDLNVGNTDEHNEIIYAKGNYELEPGYINTLRVLDKLLDLKLVPLPTTEDDVKTWVQKGFSKFFNILNSSRTATFDCVDLKKDNIRSKPNLEDYGGEALITVSDHNQDLFTLNMKVFLNKHSYIDTIESKLTNINLNPEQYNETLNIYAKQHVDQDEITRSYVGDMNTSFFYKVFYEPIRTNEQRIDRLKFLMNNFDEYKQNVFHKIHVIRFIEHLLETIAWDDENTVQEVNESIVNFFHKIQTYDSNDKQLLSDIFTKNVRSIELNLEDNFLTFFKNVEFLDFTLKSLEEGYASNKEYNLKIDSLIKLKELNLHVQDSNQKIIVSNNKLLEKLTITGHKNVIKELKLQNLKFKSFFDLQLEDINHIILDNVDINKLPLYSLPTLKKITFKNLNAEFLMPLRGASNLEKIIFEGEFPNLKKIDLGLLNNVVVKGLDKITAPKNLDIILPKRINHRIEGYQEDHLIFKNSKYNDSMIKSFINNQGNGAKVLSLINMINLNELKLATLKPLIALKKVNLENTAIKQLAIDKESTIETLKISSHKDLTKLHVTTKTLKKITLENLPELKNFKLFNANDLEKMSLKNIPQIKSLGVAGVTVGTFPKIISLCNVGIEKFEQRLFKERCEKITLKNLNMIKELNFKDCLSLTKLTLTGTFESLKTVNLTGLQNIQIKGLEIIEKIEGIQIIGLTPQMRLGSTLTNDIRQDLDKLN